MAESFAIQCSACQAQFLLPFSYRQPLEGRAAFCVGCERWWVPLPAASGPAVRLVKGRPERAPIDLRQFRTAASAEATAAASSPSVPSAAAAEVSATEVPVVGPPSAGSAGGSSAAQPMAATMRVPIRKASVPNLRVVMSVPGTELSRKGVFELGAKSFLIGRKSCHVNLPKASIPEKAIRIKASHQGFRFEGLAGFRVPVGSVSVDSGEIDLHGSLSLQLTPYLISGAHQTPLWQLRMMRPRVLKLSTRRTRCRPSDRDLPLPKQLPKAPRRSPVFSLPSTCKAVPHPLPLTYVSRFRNWQSRFVKTSRPLPNSKTRCKKR